MDENLPRDAEISGPEVEECPPGEELMPLEEEKEEGSGSEGVPGDEGSVSGQDVTDVDLQCPKEEDTTSLMGDSGYKTGRYLLVRRAECFDKAQVSGLWLRLGTGTDRRHISMCQRCWVGRRSCIVLCSAVF